MDEQEKWEKEFKVAWELDKRRFDGRSYYQHCMEWYLQACKVRQEEIEYEQTRNKLNVAQADEEIRKLESNLKELVEALEKHRELKQKDTCLWPITRADEELYKVLERK